MWFSLGAASDLAHLITLHFAGRFRRERRKWTMHAMAFCFVVTTVAAVGPAAAQTSPETETRSMPFGACLSLIEASAVDLGAAPVNLVVTDTMRMVRFLFSDGSVLITCSAVNNTLAVTLSPLPRPLSDPAMGGR